MYIYVRIMYYTNKPQLKSTQRVHTKAACVTNSIFSNLHTKTPVLLASYVCTVRTAKKQKLTVCQ